MPTPEGIRKSLERAAEYLMSIQDADMWPDDEEAAFLIRNLAEQVTNGGDQHG
jgi:hypothetical protein